MRTVLGKIINGEYGTQMLEVITLSTLDHGQIYVYRGDLPEEDFDKLKDDAYFIVLDQAEEAQLEHMMQIIAPFPHTNYKNRV